MPANNSPTNRSIRRSAALDRFKLDPKKAADEGYLERKAIEKAALQRNH